MSSAAAAQMTPEQILSDAQASEYDFFILVDKSGSMGEKSLVMPGKTRWEEAQEFTETFARYAEKSDDDGITVITFSGKPTVYDGVMADKVHEVFTTCQPGGSTNLAPALAEVFKKKAASKKKALVMVITDGAANDEDAVKQVITDAANGIATDDEIGIQFVQIGNDPHASKFLNDLDDNLKGAKFDIVNALTHEEAEGYSMGQLLWLALND